MGKKVRSARGEIIDFDLLRIKEQMAKNPAPKDVKARQDFIDRRLRRRVRKAKQPIDQVKEGETKAVSPKMPATEDLETEPKFIQDKPKAAPKKKTTEKKVEEVREEKTTKKKKTKTRRQRARPLRPSDE